MPHGFFWLWNPGLPNSQTSWIHVKWMVVFLWSCSYFQMKYLANMNGKVEILETWERTTTLLMWLWPVRMVSWWKLTRWSLLGRTGIITSTPPTSTLTTSTSTSSSHSHFIAYLEWSGGLEGVCGCEGLRAWGGFKVQERYVGWSEGPKQWIWRVWGSTIGSNQSWVRTTVPQIFFHKYSRLPLYSCPTRALLETLYLQVCYMCLIYKCKIVFVACNEIAFCFIYIVGSLGTVAQGDDSVSTQAKVTLSLLHACIKYF